MKQYYTVYPESFNDFKWKFDWKLQDNTYISFQQTSPASSSYYCYQLEVSYCELNKAIIYTVTKVEKYGPGKEIIETANIKYDTEAHAIRWLLDKLEDVYQKKRIGFKLPYVAVDLITEKSQDVTRFLLNASLNSENRLIREEAKLLETKFLKSSDYYNFYTKVAFLDHSYITNKLIKFLKDSLQYTQSYIEKILTTEVY